MIWPENRNSQAEPKTWAVVASYIKTKGEGPGENLGPWLLPAQVVRQIRSGCARGMTPIGHSFCRATVSHPECLREGGQQARPGKTDKHQPVMTSKTTLLRPFCEVQVPCSLVALPLPQVLAGFLQATRNKAATCVAALWAEETWAA